MARLPLTDESVKGLAPPTTGNRITYDVPRGPRDRAFVRGFALRVTAAGLRTFLLVYVAQNGRERRHRIGDYGPFTVHTAREAARKLRKAVDEGRDPFAEAVAAKREAEARDSAERAGRERDRATLGDLLMAYIALLEQGKKASASKVRAELVRTVQEPFPDLWDMPAGNVTADDLLRVLGGWSGPRNGARRKRPARTCAPPIKRTSPAGTMRARRTCTGSSGTWRTSLRTWRRSRAR